MSDQDQFEVNFDPRGGLKFPTPSASSERARDKADGGLRLSPEGGRYRIPKKKKGGGKKKRSGKKKSSGGKRKASSKKK